MDKLLIVGHIQAMAAHEILSVIKPSILAKIKETDPRPFFQAYIAAHEGEARPLLVGVGAAVLKWGRNIIESLKTKYFDFMPVYEGHNKDPMKPDKPMVAKIVGWKDEIINGRYSSVVVAYFSPDQKSKASELDFISMESSAEMREIETGVYNVEQVQAFSGWAVGNTKKDRPGFAGALKIAQIQAYEFHEIKAEDPSDNNKGSRKEMTRDEVIRAVRELDLKPSDLFKSHLIIGEVRLIDGKIDFAGGDEVITNTLRKKTAGFIVPDADYNSMKEKIAKLSEIEPAFKKYQMDEKKVGVKEKIASWKEEGLSDKQIKALELNLDKLILDGENTDEQIKAWKIKSLEEYKRYSELIGEANDGGKDKTLKISKGTEGDEKPYLLPEEK